MANLRNLWSLFNLRESPYFQESLQSNSESRLVEHLFVGRESDEDRAAQILRDLRDPVLLADGYHWLIVGTTQAIRTVVFSTPQVRTIVEGPRLLNPLPFQDVLTVLERRYQALRADPAKPVIAPVTDEVVTKLYEIFRGDLRGTMSALHSATHDLLSFGKEEATSPLTLSDVTPILREYYTIELATRLGDQAHRLQKIAQSIDLQGTFVQKEAQTLWEVSQTETSRTIKELVHPGYLIEATDENIDPETKHIPSPGRRPAKYAFSGAARLVFDTLLTSV